MSDTTSTKTCSGHVLEWHNEEGWGVLVSGALPDRVWAHYSVIEAEGYRELAAGQSVAFTAERAPQDEYRWRAVCVRPEAGAAHSPHTDTPPGFSSDLHIEFDS
ncbi:cold shock domain-containing protein [Streptomyces sp. L2]|uniref:cold shock domain-containing protein n=1 Tax=Streptomyces sp. L2 TaxID=2162665 RepID=UPI001F508861|nr:cold shock domain-containing protein [Streptomyces sp. L2]